jgi:hypothetical protein
MIKWIKRLLGIRTKPCNHVYKKMSDTQSNGCYIDIYYYDQCVRCGYKTNYKYY